MNITFLIGNGFDINVGLKTDYRSFLKWYLKQKSKNKVIEQFKLLIETELETWSDLEWALGQKTLEAPLNKPDNFLSCKRDLDEHLQEYLRIENKKFSQHPSRANVKRFGESIACFQEFCENEHIKAKINRLLDNRDGSECIVNIITFNYTDAVDILWTKVPAIIGGCRIDQLIHIHGTIDNMMVSGVNDATQISNESFRTNEDVVECCVKPYMNDGAGNNVNEAACNLIDKTDIFVIFGMSIGVTDKKWWDRIALQVLSRPDSYLLFVNYDANVEKSLPYSSITSSRKLIERFLEITDLGSVQKAVISKKVDVLLNTEMFSIINNYSLGERFRVMNRRFFKRRKKEISHAGVMHLLLALLLVLLIIVLWVIETGIIMV